jgi:hypothetical protein
VEILQFPVEQQQSFLRSGLDLNTWNGLSARGRAGVNQWGTNLPNAGRLIGEQRVNYDQSVGMDQMRNQQVDTFGNFQNSQMASLQSQYDQGLAMGTGRADFNEQMLREGLWSDMGLLGEQKYRNVDLARGQQGIDQGYLDTMRGLAGEGHGSERNYLNAMIGQLNDRKNLAYEKYGVNDAYMAQQGVDNAAQYGFNARGYQQELDSAFDQRGTQQRAARSDAAARGAFGAAGTRDNEQDIMDQYGRSMEAANLGLDMGNQQVDERDRAIGNNRDNLGMDYRGQQTAFTEQQLGYDRAHTNNDLGYRGQMAGYDKQGKELAQTGKALDSLAREYGIKETDLRNGFKNGVTKIGLDLADTQAQLEQMLSSGNAQLIQQGMNFMNQMMAYQ